MITEAKEIDTTKVSAKLDNQKKPPEVIYKKGAFKNFAIFTGKHLCQNLFFNKVVGLRPATSLKKRLWHRCFSVNFEKLLKNNLYTEYLWATASG